MEASSSCKDLLDLQFMMSIYFKLIINSLIIGTFIGPAS